MHFIYIYQEIEIYSNRFRTALFKRFLFNNLKNLVWYIISQFCLTMVNFQVISQAKKHLDLCHE